MLVLGRKLGDVVTIETPEGRKITVTVVNLRNHSVRIGFDAPPDFKITRNERFDPPQAGKGGR